MSKLLKAWLAVNMIVFTAAIFLAVMIAGLGFEVSAKDFPRLYINGSEQGYSQGEVILLSSLEEPMINISGYMIASYLHINVYKTDVDALLDFLVHDEKYKQLQRSVDVGDLPFMASFQVSLTGTSYSYRNQQSVLLPINEDGVFVLEIKAGELTYYAYVLRSGFGTVAHEARDQIIFWTQDLQSGKSRTSGRVTLYGLEQKKTVVDQAPIDSSGIARTKISATADLAVVESENSAAIVFLNLKSLNRDYVYGASFQEAQPSTKYFAFTDRPIYQPGDRVKFKSIIRADLNAEYRIFSGEIKVEVYTGYGDNRTIIHTDKLRVSASGAVDGEFSIPKSVRTGNYVINLRKEGEPAHAQAWWWGSYMPSVDINFLVENYRKPEYTLAIESGKNRLTAGSDLVFVIKGKYFSGQPLAGQTVEYKVSKRDYYEPAFLDYFDINDDSYYYGYYYGSNLVGQGTAVLNEQGLTEIRLYGVEKDSLKSQVYVIEASFKDSTQNQVRTRDNVLVLSSHFGVFQTKRIYAAAVGSDVDLEFILIPFEPDEKPDQREIKANVERTQWICQDEYWKCQKETEDYPEHLLVSDAEGSFVLSLDQIKKGSYSIRLSFADDIGNRSEKEFHFWAGDQYYSSGDNYAADLRVISDKEEYRRGELMNIKVLSPVDRDVFLSVERDWVQRFEVVRLSEGISEISLPVESGDIPNVRLSASSFSDSSLDRGMYSVKVSAEEYRLDVEVRADKEVYGPGEKVRLEVLTRDEKGRGVPTETSLWLVDKALFELASDNTGDIFDTFWASRWESTSMSHSLMGLDMNMAEKGGCFSADTKVLMYDGSSRPISRVRAGDKVLTFKNKDDLELVPAEVAATHRAEVGGYLIINGHLRITPNHVLLVNNEWKIAGLIQIGDELLASGGEKALVESIEWQKGKFEVYNLEIKARHTFIASGVFVHNDKGGAVRSVFEDAAYWNPSLRTNAGGRAFVTFNLPDNLTTWVISAVAATPDTKVGQARSELLVAKDIFIQPVLPNILRTGDGLVVSAIVNNFSGVDREFTVEAEFNAGRIASASQSVLIESGTFRQIDWPFFPETANEEAVIRFWAFDAQDEEIGDNVETRIPVREFGYWQTRSLAASGNHVFPINPEYMEKAEEMKIDLTLSLSALGPVTAAMDYLVKYPYGCMEQTTSRFMPVVIAKENEKLFANRSAQKDLDAMAAAGLERLGAFQNTDGGWAWWNSDRSELPLSAYIFEYVIKAKQAGINIEDNIFAAAAGFFEKLDPARFAELEASSENEAKVYKNYILALLGQESEVIRSFAGLSAESLSYAIMANQIGGFKDSAEAGVRSLLALSKKEGGQRYWSRVDNEKYGSSDASSAIALRALLAANYKGAEVDEAAAFLLENRKSHYWSNTYGTARVIQALVDYLNLRQLSGDNRYIVYLDDEMVSQGAIGGTNSLAKISIPTDGLKASGSTVRIEQEGKSLVYSVLVLETFMSDPEAKAIDNGLSITRRYINEKGANYSIGIGDVVEVEIQVSGFGGNQRYAIIEDFLPAGLVPINAALKNESGDPYSRWYWYGDYDFQKDGVQVYLSYVGGDSQTIKYKARVVNSGVYQIPPARAALMYSPEINGFSETQVLEIGRVSEEMESARTEAYDNFKASEKSAEEQVMPTKKPFPYFSAIALLVLLSALVINLIIKNKREADEAGAEKEQ